MAESDYEKTVRLPASAPKSTPVTPPAAPSADKTVKLTPADAKPVKLTVPAAPASGAPAAPAAPAAVHTPEPIAPPPPPPPPAKASKSKAVKIVAISISVLIVLLAGAWFGLPPFLKGRAEKLAKEGKYQGAAKQLSLALKIHPLKMQDYLLPLGQAQRQAKNYPDAQSALEKFLTMVPNDFAGMKELGQVYKEMNQPQKALDIFLKCATAKPMDMDVPRWAADLAFDQKNYGVAVTFYEALKTANKLEPADWINLGKSYYEAKKFPEAVSTLQAALEKDSNLKGVRPILAAIAVAENRLPDAVTLYHDELSLSPDDEALKNSFGETCLNAGLAMRQQKKLADASQYFQLGLTAASVSSANLSYNLAAVYAQQRKAKDAITNLSAAIQKDPAMKASAKSDASFASLKKNPAYLKLLK